MIWNAEQDIQLRPAEGTSGESLICVPTSAGCFIGDKMKRIPLTRGQFAIVDDEDYERLNKYKWYAQWNRTTNSYTARRRRRKGEKGTSVHILMHRQILYVLKGDEIDHYNHNTLDNRKLNLRIVTHQQNQWNRKNSKGYSWSKFAKKYIARICLNNKLIHLGYFHTAETAHTAYLKAKEKYHKI